VEVDHADGVVLHPAPAVALDVEGLVLPLAEAAEGPDRRQRERPGGLPLDAERAHQNHEVDRVVRPSQPHFSKTIESSSTRNVTFSQNRAFVGQSGRRASALPERYRKRVLRTHACQLFELSHLIDFDGKMVQSQIMTCE
jgi:hypothetical protein